jgi:hypothetical protein
MAEVVGRDELERKLARAVARALGAQRNEVLQKLGDPPDLSRLTQADWDAWGKLLSAAIGPELQAIYLQQAQTMLEAMPGGVD